jgi:hypothetical protein
MKKGMTILIISALIIFSISFMSADNNSTTAVSDKGYACLQSKVQDNCASLSTEQKTFSLLAIGQCKNELLSDAQDNQCWPNTGCTIKATSQAILALKGNPLNKSATWLLGQRMTPPGMDWLLQINPNGVGKCTVSYSSSSFTVSIDANGQITSNNLGPCLKVYTGNYWLQIQNSQSCFNNAYNISCDTSFLTNLLYKDQATSTVYVLSGLHSSSAEGKTTEQVSSYCFKQGSLCDYEGTLWAALALQSLNYDINPYVPYLITKQSQNEQYLPEAFLYALLGDAYKNNLIVLQQQGQFWSASGDKFYDTAVALLPFQQQTLAEKTNSINWLTEIQGADGCWQDNIRNTAFLLYSIWPKSTVPNGGVSGTDCEASNYFCSSQADCNTAGGTQLNYTGCFSANICCSKQLPLKTCTQQSGKVCDSGQQCTGHTTDASDTAAGACCLSGCQASSSATECSKNSGTCRSTCLTNEEQNTYGCDGNNVCCSQQPAGNYSWIIILSILIVLVLIGIIFRKKLMTFFSKFGKGKKQQSPRGPPPRGQPMQMQRMPMRRLPMPAQTRPVYRPQTAPQRKPETDEVLKKLREMGK